MTIEKNLQTAIEYNNYIQSTYGKGHYNAYVIRFCGARGSGKSLLLAMMATHDLLHGNKVWSNMPIVVTPNAMKWGLRKSNVPKELVDKWCRSKAGYIGRKTLPLDWDALYTLSEELEQGTVIIDEAQYFSDSRSALSLKNKLLNAIVMQVRKRSLNLYYSVKQGDWVDKRLSYETDVQVDCMSGHLSQWGRQRSLPAGEIIDVKFWDLSGVVTGHATDWRNPYCRPFKIGAYGNMHMFWDSYDTAKAVDLEEMMTPVKMDMQARVISNKRNGDEIKQALFHVASSMVEAGTVEIGTRDFENVANKMGIEGKMQSLGRYLRDMGITRKQKSGGEYFYNLSGLQT